MFFWPVRPDIVMSGPAVVPVTSIMLNTVRFRQIIPLIPTITTNMVDIGGYGGYDCRELKKKEGLLSSKELMKLLKSKGWVLDRIKGSHHTFVKAGRDEVITVPHPEKDVAKGTLQKILKTM